MTEIKSKVSVWAAGSGFFIEVSDQLTMNRIAVTLEELEQIVLYGSVIVRDALHNRTEVPPQQNTGDQLPLTK